LFFNNNYTSNGCTLQKLLEPFESKFTPKKLGFFHTLLVDPKICTLLGKDYLEEHIEIPKVNINFTKNSKDLKVMMQLQPSCATKDDQNNAKLKECALIAQVKAIV
jgi:hypothetical protein